MKERLIEMGVTNKIEVIPNGNKFANSRVDSGFINKINNKYNFNIEDNILIYVGRLSSEKSIDVILESLSKLNTPFKMLFIGGGDEKTYSCLAEKQNVSKRCQFLGQINNVDELVGLCSRALIQVFPSKSESFGLTIAECGGLGTPSVVTKNMATAEFIEDGVNGFIIDGTAEDLARKIDEILSDKEQLKTVSENARKTFNLTWEDVSNRYIKLYEDMVQNI